MVYPRSAPIQLRDASGVHRELCVFVRGGVYRIVKEALGGFWAKAAVSALLFDYVLTGPISGVSAGQYIVACIGNWSAGLGGTSMRNRAAVKSWGSVAIACAVTLYFFQQNRWVFTSRAAKH